MIDELMRLCIQEAITGVNQGEGGPFGAMILKDNVVVSQAHNTVLKSHDPT